MTEKRDAATPSRQEKALQNLLYVARGALTAEPTVREYCKEAIEAFRSEIAPKLCNDCGCELECVKHGCAKKYDAASRCVGEPSQAEAARPSTGAQIALDQQSDDPAPGDWNAACRHIAARLSAIEPLRVKEVWMVSSRTFMQIFDSQESAKAFISQFGAAEGGGMSLTNHEVFSVALDVRGTDHG